jgi:hypothetical protein
MAKTKVEYMPPIQAPTPVRDFFRWKFPTLLRRTVVFAWLGFATAFWYKSTTRELEIKEAAEIELKDYHRAMFFLEQAKIQRQFGAEL